MRPLLHYIQYLSVILRAVKRFSVLMQAYVLHRNLRSEPVKPLEQRPTVRTLHSQTEV